MKKSIISPAVKKVVKDIAIGKQYTNSIKPKEYKTSSSLSGWPSPQCIIYQDGKCCTVNLI